MKLKIAMVHCCQNCNLASIIIYGTKNYFSIFSSHFVKKIKTKRKCQFGKLSSNYFPRHSKLFNFRKTPLLSLSLSLSLSLILKQ